MTAPRFSLLTGPGKPAPSTIDRTLLTQQADATATRSGAPPWPRESLDAGKIPTVWVRKSPGQIEQRDYPTADMSMRVGGAGNQGIQGIKGLWDNQADAYNGYRARAFVPYTAIPSDVRQRIENQLRSSRKLVKPSLVENLAASIALDDWKRVDELVGSAENERNQP